MRIVGVQRRAPRPGSAADASRQRAASELQLAVAVELVAEEVREQQRPSAARGGRPRAAPPRRPRTARARRRARRAGSRRRPRRGSRPSCCGRPAPAAQDLGDHRRRRRLAVRRRDEHRARAAAAPRARRSAPGSSFQASFPGRVVPPPRPASRESAPTARAAATSRERGRGGPHASTVPDARNSALLQIFQSALPLLVMAEKPSRVPRRRARSTRRRSPTSRRASASATPTSRSSPSCAPHAARLGRSPTMKEFAADPRRSVHPQTAIEHFGSWNAAKRAAGLMPRRFATREELLEQLRRLGDELGRTPTARDLDERRGHVPVEVALLAHVRLARARAARGGLRRRRRRGAARAGARAGRGARTSSSAGCRSSATGPPPGARTRRCSPSGRCTGCSTRAAGAWGTFQFLVRERLLADGLEVASDGSVAARALGGVRSARGG